MRCVQTFGLYCKHTAQVAFLYHVRNATKNLSGLRRETVMGNIEY